MRPLATVWILSLLVGCRAHHPVGAPPAAPAVAEADRPDLGKIWNWDDPVASEAAFQALSSQAEASNDRALQVEALTQVARAQGLQQRYDDALRTLKVAELLCNEHTPVARIYVPLERGRVYNSSDRKAEAIPYFESAFTLAQAAGQDALAIDAAHMMAIALTGEPALEWSARAIAMAEASADPKAQGWLGPLYNNTAWTYFDMGRYDEALSLFQRDVLYRESRGRLEEAGVARWSVARVLRAQGRTEEALQMQRELLGQPGRQGNDSEGYTREEIGECLLTLGRPDEARPEFARAYALLKDDPWLKQDEPARLERMRALGEGK